jgi:hypothetical protein
MCLILNCRDVVAAACCDPPVTASLDMTAGYRAAMLDRRHDLELMKA